ncbi:hypothetical protein LIER_29050 [Lithospermum erythrorhizon]|uniref:Gag-pol polyprotein n=1 Tax=Lithospermum erythrorhizon TaxID=34254 RepID=A0AAV3RJD8_LITER
MVAYLRSMNIKTWKSVLFGWTPPQRTLPDGTLIEKPEMEWTVKEREASMENSKALDAIRGCVNINVDILIRTCASAKEAWETLACVFEGTPKA